MPEVDKINSINIDFLNKKFRYRLAKATIKKEPIAKAIGLKNNLPLNVIDTTAGLGIDAFILAHLGANITLLERNPIIASALTKGLEIARINYKDTISRMHLVEIDSLDFLAQLTNNKDSPDVIYCDPMFPVRNKSALVNKQMRMLQNIVSPDNNAYKLLEKSLPLAKKRVVIKRPKHAPLLQGPTPSFTHKYQSCRFDVYVTL